MLLAPADAKHYRAILDTIRAEAIEELDLGTFFDEARESLKERAERRTKREPRGRESDRQRRGGRRGAPRLGDRPHADEQAARPEPVAAASPSAPARPRPARRDPAKPRQERNEIVRGFGDELPAFMVR
jgi:hypothetical protein